MDENNPEVIKVPKPTNYSKINFCTEVAFSALCDQARKMNLSVQPVMGLMYLPQQETTRQFQLACRDVLRSLGVPEESKCSDI